MARGTTAKRVGEQNGVSTGRKGQSVGTNVAVAPERKRLSLKQGAVSTREPWYMKREGELAVVTADAQNASLGITNIEIFAPSEEQMGFGIVCKVRLHSLTGTDENITIFSSNRGDAGIYMKESGARKVESEGQAPKYYNDRKLNDATRAQVLSYVHQFVDFQ